MDFSDTPEEAAYRTQVRTWLSGNAELRAKGSGEYGRDLSDHEYLAASKRWQATKFDAGYAAITWPSEFGGGNGTPMQQVIYSQEEAAFNLPGRVYAVSLGMALPTVMAWAAPALKERFIRPGLRGEQVWCQLFSEPAAGSDTGGIRTRAEKQGDEWVISGQKVWTSSAHFSDYGILLARTDWDKPKQEGLTMFILDMKAPGVEVRPIHQMSGDAEFNEVFLNEVRIADGWRLGGEGEGWKVMLSTLMHERLNVAGQLPTDTHERLIELARQCEWDGRPAIEDARVHERIADAYLALQGVELLITRARSALSRGGMPGPEMALTKLVAGKAHQDFSAFALELAGPEGLLPETLGDAWLYQERMWLGAAGIRLAGGSDEVLRNVIGERVLGLPPEPRTDRKVPFRELEH